MKNIENTKFDDFCLKISDSFLKFINSGYSGLSKIDKKIYYGNSINIFLIVVIALSSFFAMLFFNSKMLYVLDDYCYRYVFSDCVMETTDKKIESLNDIFVSMKAHYSHMNGRIIIHSIVSLCMMLDKSVFNVINSLMYVVFTLAIYFNCVGKNIRKHNALLFLVINLSIWTFIKSWGITLVWLTGSINYMWGSTIRLLALLPFRFYADDRKSKHSILMAIIMLMAGIFAGQTSESMSGAFFGMVILYIIYFRIKKYRFRPFFVTTLVGTVASFVFMMMAPGNSERIEYVKTHDISSPIAQRLIIISANGIQNLSIIITAIVIFALLLWRKSKCKNNCCFAVPIIYIMGATAATLAMCFSPQFPGRAWFGIIIALIVATGCFIVQIDKLRDTYRRIFTIIVVGWLSICIVQLGYAVKYSNSDFTAFISQIESIEMQKDEGIEDVTIKSVTGSNEHSPLYGINNVADSSDNWLNRTVAKYYGVNSISVNRAE